MAVAHHNEAGRGVRQCPVCLFAQGAYDGRVDDVGVDAPEDAACEAGSEVGREEVSVEPHRRRMSERRLEGGIQRHTRAELVPVREIRRRVAEVQMHIGAYDLDAQFVVEIREVPGVVIAEDIRHAPAGVHPVRQQAQQSDPAFWNEVAVFDVLVKNVTEQHQMARPRLMMPQALEESGFMVALGLTIAAAEMHVRNKEYHGVGA